MIVKKLGSQSELVRKAGISTGMINKYVKGIQVPGSEAISKIARAGGVSADWLLYGNAEEFLSSASLLPVEVSLRPAKDRLSSFISV